MLLHQASASFFSGNRWGHIKDRSLFKVLQILLILYPRNSSIQHEDGNLLGTFMGIRTSAQSMSFSSGLRIELKIRTPS